MERLFLIKGRNLLSFLVVYNTDIVKVFGHPSITSITREEYVYAIYLNPQCIYVGEV